MMLGQNRSLKITHAVVLLVTLIIIKIIGLWLIWRVPTSITTVSQNRRYELFGRKAPETWGVDLGRRVKIPYEGTVHFQLGPEDDDQWSSLFPNNGLLKSQGETFSIGMFHQLRCLNILRQTLYRNHHTNTTSKSVSALDQHCLNYLRQVFFCEADLGLEPVVLQYDGSVAPHTRICNDWTKVYDAAQARLRANPR